MIEFLLSSPVLPFSLSLGVMLAIALVEGLGLLLGLGFSSLLDNLLPELDLDVDLDADGDFASSGVTSFLGWMNIGRVPLLVIAVCFLTAFGLIGLGVQSLMTDFTGTTLPLLVVAPAALLAALPCTRWSTGLVRRLVPKDETSALNSSAFIGSVAVITLGRAAFNSPAEARVKDRFGQTHYFMVAPEEEGVIFEQGESVLLSRKNSNGFFAIKNSYETLQ